jgi:hypothetical protein
MGHHCPQFAGRRVPLPKILIALERLAWLGRIVPAGGRRQNGRTRLETERDKDIGRDAPALVAGSSLAAARPPSSSSK